MAQAELVTYLASNPDDVALSEFYYALIAEYGQAAATLAGDFYDARRLDAGVRRGFTAQIADPAPRVQTDATVRWAATADDTVKGTPKSRLLNTAQRLVLQPGRETIADSVERDPAKARWARRPNGDTCAFCLLLASRGATYRKRSAAARKFHDGCNCTPEPVWDDTQLSYDPGELQDVYAKARAEAGKGDVKAILSAMRQQQGIR